MKLWLFGMSLPNISSDSKWVQTFLSQLLPLTIITCNIKVYQEWTLQACNTTLYFKIKFGFKLNDYK